MYVEKTSWTVFEWCLNQLSWENPKNHYSVVSSWALLLSPHCAGFKSLTLHIQNTQMSWTLSLTAACGTHPCANTTTSRRASLKQITKYFNRDLQNCSFLFRETLQKGNCFLISAVLFDSFVHHRAEQAQYLFAFNFLFYADKAIPREWFGLEGISKDHPAPDLPRSSCCTIQAQTSCYCGAVDFLQGCGGVMVLECCWNTVPSPFLAL